MSGNPFFTLEEIMSILDEYDAIEDIPQVSYTTAIDNAELFRECTENRKLLTPLILGRIDFLRAKLDFFRAEVEKRGVISALLFPEKLPE